MLADSKLPVSFWSEAVASACYTLNRVLTVKIFGKTCAKSVEVFFVGYASPLRHVFLPSINRIVQEVTDEMATLSFQQYLGEEFHEDNTTQDVPLFNEDLTPDVDYYVDFTPATPSFDDDGEDHNDVIDSLVQPTPTSNPVISDEVVNDENVTNLQNDVIVPDKVMPQTLSYHREENIIGDLNSRVRTRSQLDQSLSCYYTQVAPLQNWFSFKCFISQIEPKTYKQALTEESWVNAMQEELLQFEKHGVWKLVDQPDNKRCINTKWVFKCKKDENGIIA
ncbi:uncharacterized protein LOC143537621 [Bidens hawaiensis]|uniref:uncharacterized protein LOC143537621 n=1 Tax=Bidens hawaiensis TaxID=980011 RepID=UPI0040496B1B